MIVVQSQDSLLRRATALAARDDEDVFFGEQATEALEWGSPRLIVRGEGEWTPRFPRHVPFVIVDRPMQKRWESERRSEEVFQSRLSFTADRLRPLIETHALRGNWVDQAIADLSRAAGSPFPAPLRGFARRILEYPAHYTNLHPLADSAGASRGALKARFRRRGLPSPSLYQRWFRLLAVAHTLSDRRVTVAAAARRTGFTSDGNLCRSLDAVAGLTPTEVRSVKGWNRLVIKMAWQLLTPEALAAWESFDRIFERRGA